MRFRQARMLIGNTAEMRRGFNWAGAALLNVLRRTSTEHSETCISTIRSRFVAKFNRSVWQIAAAVIIAMLLFGTGCSEKWVTSWGPTSGVQADPTASPTPGGLPRMKVAPYEPAF